MWYFPRLKKVLRFVSKISVLGSKYAIWWNSKKSVLDNPRHTGVVYRPNIGPGWPKVYLSRRPTDYSDEKFFRLKNRPFGCQISIWGDSEKSTLGGPRYLTVADKLPVATNNSKSGSPSEPLLSPIGMGESSHLWLGLVQIDIWAGQTDWLADVCQI